MRGLDNVLLVPRARAGFLGVDETGTDPNGLGAEGQGHCETATVADAAGGNDHDVLAGERGLATAANVDDLGDQNWKARRRDSKSRAFAVPSRQEGTRDNGKESTSIEDQRHPIRSNPPDVATSPV